MASQGGPKSHGDVIRRGVKKSNIPGTITFLALRSVDPFMQYQLLSGFGSSTLLKLGFTTIQARPTFVTGISALDRLGLPLPHLVLLGMSLGSAVKQNYWLLSLSAEEFPPSTAVTVGFFNMVMNSINSFLLLSAATSTISDPTVSLPLPVMTGACLFVTGVVLETLSEWQRKQFKDDPKNQGKVIRTGLWRWARHVNYGGYSLWRAGYVMASSGYLAGAFVGSALVYDFVHRAIPSLNDYCGRRYGEQWAQFKRDVTWVILPGIY